MLRIKRLKIIRYRNVEPCELTFSDGFNVLLGKNASGKTSLLRLLAMIARDRFDGLDAHARLEWDVEGPLGVATLSIDPVEERKGLQGALFETQQRRLFRFEGWGSQGALAREVDDAGTGPLLRSVMSMPPAMFNAVLASGSLRFGPGRLDEGLLSFEGMARTRPDAEVATALVMTGTEPELRWMTPTPLPGLAKSLTFPYPERLVTSHADERILAAACEAFGATGAHAESVRLRVEEAPTKDSSFATYATPEFHFEFGHEKVSHHHFSFGQKRYLAFLMHLDACTNTPFIADELTNGFHLDWINSAIGRMRGHQCFLASQNPLLVDLLTGFQSAEEARDTFLTCRVASVDNGSRVLRWANLTKNEGDAFYRLYQTGIGNTSEALHDAGLW